jgi:ArsR family transcriptional regulator, cadmium/lead-responsive transcriptional repressor
VDVGPSVEMPSDLVDLDAIGARIFRVLGDATRLGILRALLERPHNVSELIARLGLPQSRVSNHLACLRWCQFVSAQRRGRQVVYSINDPRLRELIRLSDLIGHDNRDHMSLCRRIGPDWA